jgi:hypothetical protein
MRGFDWMRTLAARLRKIDGDRKPERDLNDELSFHIEMDTQANLRRGMTHRDALRQARSVIERTDRYARSEQVGDFHGDIKTRR